MLVLRPAQPYARRERCLCMRTAVGAAIVLSGLGALPAAPAAADWSAPVPLSRPHSFVRLGAVGYTATGAAVASWTWSDDVGDRSTAFGSSTASAPPGGEFGAERALPADLVAGPTPYGRGRVAIAAQSDRLDRSRGRRTGSTLRVRSGDLSGRFGRPLLVVRRAHTIENAQLAVNGRGDGALAWSETVPGPDGIYVSLRRSGGTFAAPILLGRGPIRDISAAVGAAGDVLVAWDARGRVRARFRRRTQRAFGPTDELRSQTTFYAALQTAVSAGGRAWIAWTSQLLTEGGTIGDAYVQLARRAAGARRFDRALLLDRGPGDGGAFPSAVSLAAGPRGTAALAWTMTRRVGAGELFSTTVAGAHVSAVGVARVSPLVRFDAVEPGEQAAAAYADDGEAMVAWTQRTGAQTTQAQAFVSRRPAGGDWAAPQLAFAGSLSELRLAYAPGGGRATLLLAAPAGTRQTTVQFLSDRDRRPPGAAT